MSSRTLKRILLAEDDPDIRTITGLALGMVGGFEVRACASGPEAVDAAAAFAPDLILLDMMMPGMDGLATLAALRRIPAAASVPVVFMTAKVQAREVALYREMGAADVIAKPFDPLELAGAIQRLWGDLGAASGEGSLP